MNNNLETIRARTSVRSYAATRPDKQTYEALITLIADVGNSPFGTRVRFELLDLNDEEQSETRSLGTYGFIKGARMYILCAIEDRPHTREDLGYCLETIILGATRLGLGTCWMGGTFKRGRFAERIGLAESEILPIISPVGIPTKRRSLRERAIRLGARSNRRKPWEKLFFDGAHQTSLQPEACGPYEPCLEAVRLAPSASNKQPWRIVKDRDSLKFHFYLERSKGYDRLFDGINLQNVDMGIAMCHFELVAQESGLEGGWEEVTVEGEPWDGEYIVSWIPSSS